MEFEFSEIKDRWLRKERDISFEEIVKAITSGDIIDNVYTPDQVKHPGQMMYVLNIRGYHCCKSP